MVKQNLPQLLIFLFFSLINSKLLFVHEHFRHGQRSSLMGYRPKEYDYLGNKWDEYGQLTPVGETMLYLQGFKAREKYKDFISNGFQIYETYAFSTNTNRSKTSLNCYLNGLFHNRTQKLLNKTQYSKIYPPGDVTEAMKKEAMRILPKNLPEYSLDIPINVYSKFDHFIGLAALEVASDCEPNRKLRKIQYTDSQSKQLADKFLEKYQDKIHAYYKKYNIKYLIKDISKIDIFCDHYISAYANGIDLTKLIEFGIDIEELKNTCDKILSYVMSHVALGNKDIALSSGTPLMSQITLWMENRIMLEKEGSGDELINNMPKFVVWSGHDITLASVMMWMKLFFKSEFVNPEFGSKITFELHKIDKKYVVKYIVDDKILGEYDFFHFRNTNSKNYWTMKQIKDFCKFTYGDIEKMNQKIIKLYWYLLYMAGVIIVISLLKVRHYYNLKHGNKDNTIDKVEQKKYKNE